MKARFALDLSESRIALLHRGASGWQPVGAVEMDDADLDLNIARMRAKAEAYSGEAIRADLILPQEMVLYMELPRMPERDAEEHIEHALHGRTPYALHQLAYDFEFEDGMCLVAIVARETLREAAEFATGHGIEVASFAAAPDGERRHIPGFPVSAMIEPEPAPLVAIPEEALVSEADEQDDDAAVEAAAAEAVEAEAAQAEEVYGPIDMRAAEAGPAPVEEEEEIEIPEAPEAAAGEEAPAAAEADAAEAAADGAPEEEEAGEIAAYESSVSAGRIDEGAASHEGAMRAALSRGDLGVAAESGESHVISFSPASERAARAGRSFAAEFGDSERRTISESTSRISFSPVGGPERNLSLGTREPSIPSSSAAPGSFAARRAAIASITGIDTGAGTASAIRQADAPAGTTAFASQIELPRPETPRDESDAMTVFGARGMPEPRLVAARAMFAVAAAVVLLIGLGAFTASWLFGPDDPLGASEPLALAPASPAAEPELEFGPARDVPVVTADIPDTAAPEAPEASEIAALDALIEESDAAVETVEAEIAAPAPQEVAEAELAAPGAEAPLQAAEAEALTPEQAVEAALSEALGLAPSPAEAPAEAAPLPSLADIAGQPAAAFEARPASAATASSRGAGIPQESDIVLPEAGDPSRDEILASYAATGIWPVAPGVPRTPGQGPVAVRLPQSGDAALRRAVGALGAPSELGAQPASALPPVGPGITFDLDERGLVTPTADGTLNPEGILVYAGAPVKTPPLRVVKAPEPDARVVGAKPRARPEVPPEVVSRLEAANAAATARLVALEGVGPNGFVLGPQDVSVRALHEGRKPKARPSEESADASGAISAEEAREALFRPEERVVEDPTTSGFAVAVSARPTARPAAIAASAATPAQPEVAPQAATPQPAVARSAGPRLPTQASVARAATTPDAIKLRTVNLIGVYGTQTKRRALVRLSNGRFVKVKVGDKLDGGVVQAISENALQYQKGRKQVVIALPQT